MATFAQIGSAEDRIARTRKSLRLANIVGPTPRLAEDLSLVHGRPSVAALRSAPCDEVRHEDTPQWTSGEVGAGAKAYFNPTDLCGLLPDEAINSVVATAPNADHGSAHRDRGHQSADGCHWWTQWKWRPGPTGARTGVVSLGLRCLANVSVLSIANWVPSATCGYGVDYGSASRDRQHSRR